MRHIIILITLALAVYLASSSPIDHEHQLVDRPSVREIFGARTKRQQYAKGGKRTQSQPLEFGLRKGEYVCGNKVCKLTPEDKVCPICQRPLGINEM